MALRAKVLQIKAEKFEAKKLQIHRVTKEQVSTLEPLLQEVYCSRRPKPSEYEVRRDLIRVFNEIAKEIYSNSKDIPVVEEFGSFVMDLFSTTSDLDLSVNFRTSDVSCPRDKKIQTLRKFAKKLYAIQSKGHVKGVLPITTAKVPILKCVDCGTGVECDISVENRDGILKSKIIHIISSIDERFQKLCFLMKTWAKSHNINSSKDKTLNSLSIILLVAFHLQTRNPPILPTFSTIFKDGTDPATVVKSLPKFVYYGKNNRESLAELFVTLLIKLSSIEKLWAKGLCASACDGSWTSKTWGSKVACISVEDFTDRTQNVARAVGPAEVKKIYKCIDISIRNIFSFMGGHITRDRLRDLLFGQDGIPTRIPNIIQNSQKRRGQVLTVDSVSAKRIRMGEGWAGTPNPSSDGHVDLTVGHVIPFDPSQSQTPNGDGWERTQQPSCVGWKSTQQPSGGGWERTQQQNGGWERTQQPNGGGWGRTQQPSGGGWERTQQLSWGSWERTQQPSWGGTQQLSVGGWGGTQQPVGRLGWNL